MESPFNLGNMGGGKTTGPTWEMSNPPAGGKQKLPDHQGVKSALSNNSVHTAEDEPAGLCFMPWNAGNSLRLKERLNDSNMRSVSPSPWNPPRGEWFFYQTSFPPRLTHRRVFEPLFLISFFGDFFFLPLPPCGPLCSRLNSGHYAKSAKEKRRRTASGRVRAVHQNNGGTSGGLGEPGQNSSLMTSSWRGIRPISRNHTLSRTRQSELFASNPLNPAAGTLSGDCKRKIKLCQIVFFPVLRTWRDPATLPQRNSHQRLQRSISQDYSRGWNVLLPGAKFWCGPLTTECALGPQSRLERWIHVGPSWKPPLGPTPKVLGSLPEWAGPFCVQMACIGYWTTHCLLWEDGQQFREKNDSVWPLKNLLLSFCRYSERSNLFICFYFFSSHM